MRVLIVAVGLSLGSACALPQIDNPFDRPEDSLIVEPAAVSFGVSQLQVADVDRQVDFRTVFEVDGYGDFYVRDWSSNDDTVYVEIDVLDDAFGPQELVLRLDDGDVLTAQFDVQ